MMELASSSHLLLQHRWGPVEGGGSNLGLKHSQAFLHRRVEILYAGGRPNWRSSFVLPQRKSYSQHLGKKRTNPPYCCYATTTSGGDVEERRRRRGGGGVGVGVEVEEAGKVMIPGLPQGTEGDNRGSHISSCVWEWKPKLSVYYETSGMDNVDAPPLLLLPGFGAGSFHYEKQLKDLGRSYRVWALDFVGQGRSLPSEDPAPPPPPPKESPSSSSDEFWGFGDESEPWAKGLVYSVDLWKDQVQDFIEQVIGEPVYMVGNSLGGFVALYSAACNPELVKGITLLNATPFWGFLPNPNRSPKLSKFFPWAGTFPLPPRVRKVTEFVWQKISDPDSIHEILKQVYADHSTKVDKVFSHIIDITQHPAAAASFASIMFAPRGQMSFQEALLRCKTRGVPICLMYGREDPWVTPIWGLRVKQQLPEAPYYEISPAGHCPHDEVPEVINFLLRGWIKNLESQGSVALPLLEEHENHQYIAARKQVEYIKEGSSKKSVQVQIYGSKFSFWHLMRSFVKSRLPNFHTSTSSSSISISG